MSTDLGCMASSTCSIEQLSWPLPHRRDDASGDVRPDRRAESYREPVPAIDGNYGSRQRHQFARGELSSDLLVDGIGGTRIRKESEAFAPGQRGTLPWFVQRSFSPGS